MAGLAWRDEIVHAASEMFPYMKTGGLADAVGALAAALADDGHEVAVFLPGIARRWTTRMRWARSESSA